MVNIEDIIGIKENILKRVKMFVTTNNNKKKLIRKLNFRLYNSNFLPYSLNPYYYNTPIIIVIWEYLSYN